MLDTNVINMNQNTTRVSLNTPSTYCAPSSNIWRQPIPL